jgi:hypothetical protein
MNSEITQKKNDVAENKQIHPTKRELRRKKRLNRRNHALGFGPSASRIGVWPIL